MSHRAPTPARAFRRSTPLRLRRHQASTHSTLHPAYRATSDWGKESLETSETQLSMPSVSTGPKSPAGRGSRIKRYGTQPTRLEAVEDPLGPLGASSEALAVSSTFEAPPQPPQKEQAASRASKTTPTASQASIRSMMDSVNLDDDEEERPTGPRIPPPVEPASNDAPKRTTQPSVSVEQAAKPTFNITVGDPHKVGDLTSSHTEYQVSTKVCGL